MLKEGALGTNVACPFSLGPPGVTGPPGGHWNSSPSALSLSWRLALSSDNEAPLQAPWARGQPGGGGVVLSQQELSPGGHVDEEQLRNGLKNVNKWLKNDPVSRLDGRREEMTSWGRSFCHAVTDQGSSVSVLGGRFSTRLAEFPAQRGNLQTCVTDFGKPNTRG